MNEPANPAVTPMTPAEIEVLVSTTARALGLPLAAEHRPGVVRYFALASSLAERVMTTPLGPEDESGSVFVPVAPRGPQ